MYKIVSASILLSSLYTIGCINSAEAKILGAFATTDARKMDASTSISLNTINKNPKGALEKGVLNYQSGEYQRAIEHLSSIKTNDINSLAQIQNLIALSYLQLSDFVRAESAVDRVMPTVKKLTTFNAAKLYNTKGTIALKKNDYDSAIANLQQAKKIYSHIDDSKGAIGSTINIALAKTKLGQYRQALSDLDKLDTSIESSSPEIKVIGYKSLGNIYRVFGDYEQSILYLNKALENIQLNNNPSSKNTQAEIYLDLGNVYQYSDPQKALDFYQNKVINETDNSSLQVLAYLNQVEPLYQLKRTSQAVSALDKARKILLISGFQPELELQRIAKVMWLSKRIDRKLTSIRDEEILNKLSRASQPEFRSYALGTLASIQRFEYDNLDLAIDLNSQATLVAVNANLPEIAYRWQHSLGEIYALQGDRTQAIEHYKAAVQNLAKVRKNLVAYNPQTQFSFAEDIEPIYRELVGLLVQVPSQNNLVEARNTIESLQLAELENYFRRACLSGDLEAIDDIDVESATVYPIILEDRVASIATISGKLHYAETLIDKAEVESTIDEFLSLNNPAASNKRRRQYGKKIHDWLVAPHKEKLVKNQIKTLVFVPDGKLRNIPISAIGDEKYLIEEFAVALTPGLQLLESRKLADSNLDAIVGGLSQSYQGFAPLPGVDTEVETIQQTINAKTLLNEEFTKDALKQTLANNKDSPILHLATHGKFSSNPDETFVVTADGRINVTELQNTLRVREETPKVLPVEFLVLSACETARGDERAALGLAGIALASGARSTLGTLWSVNDRSTTVLMDELYRSIQNNPAGKAEILRQAQLKLLSSSQFNHPYYWSPFVLIGNWE